MRTLMGRMLLVAVGSVFVAQVTLLFTLVTSRDRPDRDGAGFSWPNRIVFAIESFEASADVPPILQTDVASIEHLAALPPLPSPTAADRERRMMLIATSGWQGLETRAGRCDSVPECLEVWAPSRDGRWIHLKWVGPHESAPRLPLPFLGILFTVVMIAAGSALVARQIARRLTEVSKAAELLATDFRGAPISEHGPEEIRRLAHALNLMRSRLMRHLESQTLVLEALRHDLRTPVTRLRLVAEMSEGVGQALLEDVNDIEALVQSSLEVLRGGPSVTKLEPLEISPLVERLVSEAAELGQDARYVPPTEGLRVAGDPQALRRCLRNLIENAVKFGSRATATVSADADHVYVHIDDVGPGIAAEHLQEVFLPFFRLDRSRSRETGGTGLGLSIALDIAQAHGGVVQLENRPTGGLRATLVLPRSP